MALHERAKRCREKRAAAEFRHLKRKHEGALRMITHMAARLREAEMQLERLSLEARKRRTGQVDVHAD